MSEENYMYQAMNFSEDEIEDDDDDCEALGLFASHRCQENQDQQQRSAKRVKVQATHEQRVEANVSCMQHCNQMEKQREHMIQLGCFNTEDPLTDVKLSFGRPLVALCSEDNRMFAFDLHSLYHLVIKKDKLRFKTFACRFSLQQLEAISLIEYYVQHYGTI